MCIRDSFPAKRPRSSFPQDLRCMSLMNGCSLTGGLRSCQTYRVRSKQYTPDTLAKKNSPQLVGEHFIARVGGGEQIEHFAIHRTDGGAFKDAFIGEFHRVEQPRVMHPP